MNKRLSSLLIFMVVLSLILSACATATPAVVETAAPVVATETAVPATATAAPSPTAEPAPDIVAIWSGVVANLPADKSYGAISAAKLNEALIEKPPFLLDVREAAELEKDGFIEGAVNIPVREVLKNLDKLPAMDQPIVIYCGSGHRGSFLQAALVSLGYTDVKNLGGGLGAWKKAELPVVTGETPAAPTAGEAPVIADPALFAMEDEFFSNLPEGFLAISSAKLNEQLADKAPFLLDVRTAKEFDETGYIDGAVNIPLQDLFASLDQLPAMDQPIVIYCGSGQRGGLALVGLKLLGYENVLNLGGGLNAWKAGQFPVAGWVDWNAVWGDFLTNMPSDYYSISAANLNAAMADKAPFLLDVREAAEVEKDGFIEGAVNIPVRDVLKNLDKLPGTDQQVVIYCASGHRGAFAMAALRLLGYDAINLGGGLGAWKKAELPVVTGETPAAPVAGAAAEVDATRLAKLDDFLTNLPEGFNAISAANLNVALAETKPFILDVRTAEELAADGYIEGSVNIPVVEVWGRLSELPSDKAAPIVVMCKSGHRGALVAMALQMNGYTGVKNLGGGLGAWIAAELPVVK